MHKPAVTVGISFFNNQDTLRDAVTSVLNQTYSNWELILTDDGSSDQSLRVARQCSDDRIMVIADGRHTGLVARLNQLVTLAAGRYFARMDADDIMHPERLERQVQFLNSHPDVDVVDTMMYAMNQAGNVTGERGTTAPAEWTLRSILLGNTMHHATVMGSIEWFRAYPYDPLYVRAEDVELWCRSVRSSVFARIMRPLYYVREGGINVSNYRRSQRTVRRIIRQYGRGVLRWRETQGLVLRSHIKACVYTIMGWMGMQGVLTGTRNTKLQHEALEEARQMLRVAIKG